MTVLKEVSLPSGLYYAPGVDIATQVEIDQIAEFYSIRHNMHIVPLGSNTCVTPGETVYVVAHGNANGGFTKLPLPKLRDCLRNHGVVSGQAVVLAGCFTRIAAVGGMPDADFQVRVAGFEGVLNVVENRMTDLENTEHSLHAHQALTRNLENAWTQAVARASQAMSVLAKSLTKQNANEVRDYFESGMFDTVLLLRPIKFGNSTSGASALSQLTGWLNNTMNTSWRNAIWPEIFKAMSILARFDNYLVFDTTSPGTGKTALLIFAATLDNEHTRLFVEVEQRQARYQAGIEQNLRKLPLDPAIH